MSILDYKLLPDRTVLYFAKDRKALIRLCMQLHNNKSTITKSKRTGVYYVHVKSALSLRKLQEALIHNYNVFEDFRTEGYVK